MIYFGKYLKDYLEANNISQTEFALRMGVTQKHINEIINGKTNISLDMAIDIERLTNIDSKFIIDIEGYRKVYNDLIKTFGNEENIKNNINKNYNIKELKQRKWIHFKDETNIIQICIDLLNFMKVRNFQILNQLEEKVLFKKEDTDFSKLNLWISRCDELAIKQDIKEYNKNKFNILIQCINIYLKENEPEEEELKKILNNYGIYFVIEKPLKNTNIKGCFKVKGTHPAIYLSKINRNKREFYLDLFHELGHCKSDYNEAQNKVIVEGNKLQEKRADIFAKEQLAMSKI